MRLVTLLALGLALAAPAVHAQALPGTADAAPAAPAGAAPAGAAPADGVPADTVAARGAQPGDVALLLGVNGFALGTIDGGVGAKWWVGRATALTVGARLGAYAFETSQSADPSEYFNSQIEAGLAVGAEFHLGEFRERPRFVSRAFSPFVSVGLGGYVQRVRSSVSGPTGGTNALIVEATVGFGVEYHVTDRISLAGQQRLAARHLRGREVSEGVPAERERTRTEYVFGVGTSALTLGVYF